MPGRTIPPGQTPVEHSQEAVVPCFLLPFEIWSVYEDNFAGYHVYLPSDLCYNTQRCLLERQYDIREMNQ